MTPIPVRLWIDPGCPWAWQTATWLRGLAVAGRIAIDWRIFSLELNSAEPDTPFWDACERQGESLLALALARREEGDQGFERFFLAIGRKLHEEKLEPSPKVVRSAAVDAGMRDIVDRAIGTPELVEEVRAEFQEARDESVFGVPTLGIGGAKVLYGPIIARAPEGEDAERLWEHTLWFADRPNFFELKRWPRDIRPGEAGPRTVARAATDP